MYKNRIAYSLAVILFLVIVIFIVIHHGDTNRIFASDKTILTVDSPEKAYLIWKEKKVRGRTLVLFDNYPHAQGLISYNGNPVLSHSNLVEYSIFKNVIRKIYFVVPDIKWEEFRKQKEIRPIREVPDTERSLYLFNLNGIPFIAVSMSALPQISEETLVYINNDVYDHAQTLELLARKKIASDIIISYQGHGR